MQLPWSGVPEGSLKSHNFTAMKRIIHQQSPRIVKKPGPEQRGVVAHRRLVQVLGSRSTTLEQLATGYLQESGIGIATPLMRRRLLREAVRSLSPESAAAELAAIFAPHVETLLRADIAPERLLADESDQLRRLAEVLRGYRDGLQARGLIDPAELFWRVAELDLPRQALSIYGFFRPRRDELTLLDRLAGDGSEFILPGAEEPLFKATQEALKLLTERGWEIAQADGATEATAGWEIGRRILAGRGGGDGVCVLTTATIDAEVRAVLGRVRQLLADGVSPEEIALVSNDERAYGAALRAIGWEYDLPVRLDAEIPLEEWRFGSWVRQLLEMVGSGFDYEPTLRFLQHTLSRRIAPGRLAEARRHRPVGLAAWRELAIDPWPADWPAWPGGHSVGQAVNWPVSLAAAESEAGGPGGALRREWIATLDAALLLVGQPLAEIDLAVAARLRVALGELVEWGGEEWLSPATFVEEMTELLAALRLAVPHDRPAVGLYRPEAMIGTRFEHLFILGMIEGVVPGSVAEEPILDLHERKRLRLAGFPLETAADLVRNEKLGLLLTCAAATVSITLSQPRMKGNEATIASALLAGIIDCGDENRAPLSLEEQRRAGQAGGPRWSEIQLALAVERRRELATGRDEYDGITGRGLEATARSWSASQLTKFGQCRFRWFSQYLLGVAEDDELPEEVTARQYGRLFHRVLELALLDLPEGTDPRAWALARLETAFAAAENDPDNRLYKFPAWAAQRHEWLSSLREAIESEQFITAGAAIIGREARFVGSWHGLRVNGSIDRIDRTAEGVELVDYKTSSSFPRGARDGSGRLKLDLQLPIYIEAAGAQLFPDERVTGRYYSLTRRQNLVQREPADATQLEGFAAMVRQSLAEGDFAVDPDVAGEACAYCEFELICRRGPRLARKTGGETGSPEGAEVAE